MADDAAIRMGRKRAHPALVGAIVLLPALLTVALTEALILVRPTEIGYAYGAVVTGVMLFILPWLFLHIAGFILARVTGTRTAVERVRLRRGLGNLMILCTIGAWVWCALRLLRAMGEG